MLRATLLLAAGALVAAAPVHASGEDASDAEKAVNYRQAVFTAMGYNFGPMVAMVKGEIAWDGEQFAKRASRVADLATMPWEGFGEATAEVPNTDAKAAIWEDPDKFGRLQDQLAKRTAKLAEAAAGGAQRGEVAQAFKRVGETCKSCHDDYKTDD
jgi:cytochrome c556